MKSFIDNPYIFSVLVRLAHEVDGLNYTLHHPIDAENELIIKVRKDNAADQLGKLVQAIGVNDAIQSIIAERLRQDAKWGEQNHEPQYWMGLLMEEVGELAQAVNETVFDNGPEERKKGGYYNMRQEAIQVAAVAVAFVERLDRRYSDDKQSSE